MARDHVLVKLQRAIAMVNSQNRHFEYFGPDQDLDRTKGISSTHFTAHRSYKHSTKILEKPSIHCSDFAVSHPFPFTSPMMPKNLVFLKIGS
jgi:hypothetical protein